MRKYVKRRLFTKKKKNTVKKIVKSMLDKNIEDKYAIYNTYFYKGEGYPHLTNTPFLGLLNAPIKGTNRENRLGDRIRIKRLDLNFYVKSVPNANADPTTVRMALLRLIGVNGELPSAADVFSDPDNPHFSDWNYNQKGVRFSVIWDKRVDLGIGGGTANYGISKTFRRTIFQKNTITQFFSNVNDGTIASIISGAYVLILASNQATNSETPDVGVNIITHYEDA